MNYGDLINKPDKNSVEVLGKRTENSKTFANPDGTFTWGGKIGEIHYKENYGDDKEEWKEIDTTLVDMGDHFLMDKAPIIVKVYKNKTGYEITSRKSGHKVIVELAEINGKPKTKYVNDNDLEFQFDVQSDRVRLWKYLKTDKAPKKFKWKMTEFDKGTGNDLIFREIPDAEDLIEKEKDGLPKKVTIVTKKTTIDTNSFYWEEISPKTGVKVDTDWGPTAVNASNCDSCSSTSGANTTINMSLGGYAGQVLGYTGWLATNMVDGFRWVNVNIPQGANVSATTLTLHEHPNLGGSGNPALTVYGELALNSAAFATSANDLTNRTSTTATVAWTLTQPTNNTDFSKTGLQSIIEEIVGQASWEANNALSLLVTCPSGTNYVYISSWDLSTSTCARLSITYTEGGTSTTSSSSTTTSTSTSTSTTSSSTTTSTSTTTTLPPTTTSTTSSSSTSTTSTSTTSSSSTSTTSSSTSTSTTSSSTSTSTTSSSTSISTSTTSSSTSTTSTSSSTSSTSSSTSSTSSSSSTSSTSSSSSTSSTSSSSSTSSTSSSSSTSTTSTSSSTSTTSTSSSTSTSSTSSSSSTSTTSTSSSTSSTSSSSSTSSTSSSSSTSSTSSSSSTSSTSSSSSSSTSTTSTSTTSTSTTSTSTTTTLPPTTTSTTTTSSSSTSTSTTSSSSSTSTTSTSSSTSSTSSSSSTSSTSSSSSTSSTSSSSSTSSTSSSSSTSSTSSTSSSTTSSSTSSTSSSSTSTTTIFYKPEGPDINDMNKGFGTENDMMSYDIDLNKPN